MTSPTPYHGFSCSSARFAAEATAGLLRASRSDGGCCSHCARGFIATIESRGLKPAAQVRGGRRGFTLIEIVLVVGMLAMLAAITMPDLYRRIQKERLPTSAENMRSLLTMVRSHAQFDGRRYRIRFPYEEGEDDEEALYDDRQPIIEREDDPFLAPGEFIVVRAAWAFGARFSGGVWCAEVRLGRPTVEMIEERRSRIEDAITEAFQDFEPERPPLIIETDGTSEWATFVLTDAPRDTDLEDISDESQEFNRIEIVADGETGIAWLQRPFYEEELDMFEEENWPIVLRQDHLDPRVLTEDDVLEFFEPSAGDLGFAQP